MLFAKKNVWSLKHSFLVDCVSKRLCVRNGVALAVLFLMFTLDALGGFCH